MASCKINNEVLQNQPNLRLAHEICTVNTTKLWTMKMIGRKRWKKNQHRKYTAVTLFVCPSNLWIWFGFDISILYILVEGFPATAKSLRSGDTRRRFIVWKIERTRMSDEETEKFLFTMLQFHRKRNHLNMFCNWSENKVMVFRTRYRIRVLHGLERKSAVDFPKTYGVIISSSQ